MDVSVSLMLSLIKGEALGLPCNIDSSAQLSEEDLRMLYKLSKAHDMSHIVGSAIQKTDIVLPQDVSDKLQKQAFNAMYRFEKIDYELQQIKATLEDGEVAFVPLKGSVIRKYYAEPWQRTSCDIDMLVRESNLDRAIGLLVDKLQYRCDIHRNYHDVSLYSPSGVHLELHFNIKENLDNIDHLLERVWDFCCPSDGKGFEYRQTNEFLMFHLIAHTSYHYIRGGCGIKPFVDLYLLREKLEYDRVALEKMCRACSLEKFYRGVNALIDVWFDGKEHTELTANMQYYILNGGVYGLKDQSIAVRQKRDGGKARYLFRRVFAPYKILKAKYPVLEKHKYLTPVFQVRRWIEMMCKGKLKSSVREYKTVQNMTEERYDRITSSFEELGLL